MRSRWSIAWEAVAPFLWWSLMFAAAWAAADVLRLLPDEPGL